MLSTKTNKVYTKYYVVCNIHPLRDKKMLHGVPPSTCSWQTPRTAAAYMYKHTWCVRLCASIYPIHLNTSHPTHSIPTTMPSLLHELYASISPQPVPSIFHSGYYMYAIFFGMGYTLLSHLNRTFHSIPFWTLCVRYIPCTDGLYACIPPQSIHSIPSHPFRTSCHISCTDALHASIHNLNLLHSFPSHPFRTPCHILHTGGTLQSDLNTPHLIHSGHHAITYHTIFAARVVLFYHTINVSHPIPDITPYFLHGILL